MIEASRCPRCSLLEVPTVASCPSCGTGTREANVAPEGVVIARTRLRHASSWIVLVRLEAGARVLARSDERIALGETCRVRAEGDERFRVADVGDDSG